MTDTNKLYGAFLITRLHRELKWDDSADLVYMSTRQKEAETYLTKYAEREFSRLKVVHGYRKHVRLAFMVKEIPLGQPLPRVQWNDCKHYHDYYYDPEELELRLKSKMPLS